VFLLLTAYTVVVLAPKGLYFWLSVGGINVRFDAKATLPSIIIATRSNAVTLPVNLI
jgi:hypothetical protein